MSVALPPYLGDREGKGGVLAAAGGGLTRQRRGLSREGSGSTRQRRCVSCGRQREEKAKGSAALVRREEVDSADPTTRQREERVEPVGGCHEAVRILLPS